MISFDFENAYHFSTSQVMYHVYLIHKKNTLKSIGVQIVTVIYNFKYLKYFDW